MRKTLSRCVTELIRDSRSFAQVMTNRCPDRPEVSPHFVTGELFERTQPYGPSRRSVSDPEPGRLELSSRSRSLGSDSRRRAKMRGSLRIRPPGSTTLYNHFSLYGLDENVSIDTLTTISANSLRIYFDGSFFAFYHRLRSYHRARSTTLCNHQDQLPVYSHLIQLPVYSYLIRLPVHIQSNRAFGVMLNFGAS